MSAHEWEATGPTFTNSMMGTDRTGENIKCVRCGKPSWRTWVTGLDGTRVYDPMPANSGPCEVLP